jgi:hypothetical protein
MESEIGMERIEKLYVHLTIRFDSFEGCRTACKG